VLPPGPVDYRGRIEWSSRPDSIGLDYLMCASRRVRDSAKWEARRTVLADTLFQLDAARAGEAVFVPRTLAYQRSDAPQGHTRGSLEYRIKRRTQDAESALPLVELILERHGEALERWGRPILEGVLGQGVMYALLHGEQARAAGYAWQLLRAAPSIRALGLLGLSGAGRQGFLAAYRLRERLK
jgi:hypothetical protein